MLVEVVLLLHDLLALQQGLIQEIEALPPPQVGQVMGQEVLPHPQEMDPLKVNLIIKVELQKPNNLHLHLLEAELRHLLRTERQQEKEM